MLQFKNYKCAWKNTEDDGSWKSGSYDAKHHTAVVLSKPSGDGAVKVLHQNYNNKKNVHESTFQLFSNTHKKGKTEFKLTVTGKVKAYKPIKK